MTAPVEQSGPDLPIPEADAPLGPDDWGRTLLLRLLAPRARALYGLALGHWPRDDVEYVHDLRVNARRLREALALAAPALAREPARRAARAARDLARALGDRRAADVLVVDFDRLLGPDFLVGEALRPRVLYFLEKKGYRSVLTMQATFTYRRLHKDAARLGALIDDSPSTLSLRELGSAHLHARIAEVRRGLPSMEEADAIEAQHDLRKAFKHLRYTTDMLRGAFRDLFGGPEAKTFKRIQNALGDLNDARDLRDVLTHPKLEKRLDPTHRGLALQKVEALERARYDDARRVVHSLAAGVLDHLSQAAADLTLR